MRYLKTLFCCALLVALSSGLAHPAQAALNLGDDINLNYVKTGANNASGSSISFANGGGPFWAKVYDDVVSSNYIHVHSTSSSISEMEFYTFCVERNEYFTPGNTYDVMDLSQMSQTSNRLLSGYSAWVFDKFVTGVANNTLNPRDNLTATKDKLALYQQAIWAGMVRWKDTNNNGTWQSGELMYIPGLDKGSTAKNPEWIVNDWSPYATIGISYAQFLADTGSGGWNAGLTDEQDKLANRKGYRLMNLQTSSAGTAQDQIIVPPPPNAPPPVPEPGSLVVWSLLAGIAAGVAVARTRREAA